MEQLTQSFRLLDGLEKMMFGAFEVTAVVPMLDEIPVNQEGKQTAPRTKKMGKTEKRTKRR